MNYHKDLVLFDLDGFLADDSHRVQYALDKKWALYFDKDRMMADPILLAGREIVMEYATEPNYEIQYLTGRRLDRYETSARWLGMHGLPNPERITMRGWADRDILAKYKAGVIKNALEGGMYASVLLYDDDPEVVNHINEVFGGETAFLTTHYIKNAGMVKAAKA